MKRFDLIRMALQNLWARKASTAFNIFGIVVSCSMLLLVFAGTRGAHEGLLNLFSESDLAKQFSIRAGRNLNAQPKTEKTEHSMPTDGVAEDRVTRIREKLDKDWESKNYPMTRVTLDKLTELRESPEIASVLPIQAMRAQLTIGEHAVPARVVCVADDDSKRANLLWQDLDRRIPRVGTGLQNRSAATRPDRADGKTAVSRGFGDAFSGRQTLCRSVWSFRDRRDGTNR